MYEYDPDSAYWKSEFRWSEIREETCPDCKGEGIAHAWIEKKPATSQNCYECKGTGKITQKIKVDVGMQEKQLTCKECNGTGKKDIPMREIVHVQTLSSINYEGGDDLKKSRYYDVEITDENREFFSKSKPRFS